jgi:hypothetical protein
MTGTKNLEFQFWGFPLPFVLHRAPESFAEKARRGAAWTPRVFRRDRDGPSKDPAKDEERRAFHRNATQGALFFRLFLLGMQKKGTHSQLPKKETATEIVGCVASRNLK